MSPGPGELSRLILEEARALGFHRVGIGPAGPALGHAAYEAWLAAGMHGEMDYLAADDHRGGRADLRAILAGARSVVAVALAHDASLVPAERLTRPSGQVARYARGRDYHLVMKEMLRELAARVGRHAGRPVAARPCVDTAPVLEREVAARAGLGFVGKNNMLIAPGIGSYVLLGELLLDVELEPSAAEAPAARCGECRACLDACPTGAFVGPFQLDARRCISYLTIEHRGPIPRELRPLIGTRVFGCDVCQEVCPFNAAAPARVEPAPALRSSGPDRDWLDLVRVLGLGTAQLRRLVRRTSLRRAGRDGLLRNVCVALGNAGNPAAVPALARALGGHRSPLVRSHAAWALGRLGARDQLGAALAGEADPGVRGEIEAALAEIEPVRAGA
ncbi:MAG TPA: tRNA epoxyqueuosine(34) reductase QueG [Kofleriaceae bacterium]|nr:tRNA epoxyqueuosine(34) reductase QueG [Kofleriaceae bacterium]